MEHNNHKLQHHTMNLRLALALAILVCYTYSIDLKACPTCPGCNRNYDSAWVNYTTYEKKNYPSCSQQCFRRRCWERTCKVIDEYNSRREYGSSEGKTFKLGLNSMADMTEEEKACRFGLVMPSIAAFSHQRETTADDVVPRLSMTTYLNYAETGGVSPVKDQGACGNCWAHAACGAMEYQLFKTYGGQLVELSVQQMSDCCNSDIYSSHGCRGGWMIGAYTCTKEKGICSSQFYPLKNKDQNCSTPVGNQWIYSCSGYVTIASYDESSIMDHLVNGGTISCAICANLASFFYYKSGVYSDANCTGAVNHAVTIVGFGTTKEGIDYWIFKNSWGTSWGEGGYCRFRRDVRDCSLTRYCSYPTKCVAIKVEPPTTTTTVAPTTTTVPPTTAVTPTTTVGPVTTDCPTTNNTTEGSK